MRRFAYFMQMTAVCAMSLFFAGCGSVASSTPTSSHADRDHGHDNHHGENGDDSHVHGNTKPHGGFLIELGHDHKYHAELVEDEATETVAVHILDARLNEVAIGESSILIQLTADGQTAAYELVAARNDEKENRSRFESKDQGLFRSLHRGDSFGKLRVSIDGAPYVGRIAHHEHDHHDHDGHDHDNHDHDNNHD